MKNKALLTLVALLFSVLGYSQPQTYNVRVHDPVMIKQADTYYLFHTDNGVSIKKSKDRIHWEDAGSVFAKEALPKWHKDDIPEQNGHLWAPDIHYRDGKYHLYYSVSAWMDFNSSIGYATNVTLDSNDPAYEWVDEGKVIDFRNGGEGVNCIDPNIFVDEDGKVWMLYGSYKAGLRMVELDRKTGKLPSEQPELIVLTTSLGEGVYLIKSGGYYYLFASRGRCCAGIESTYQVVMGRSKNIKGPYLNKEGESWVDNHYSLFMAGDYEQPGKGHNGFFNERDTTFMVYHAYTRSAEPEGASLLSILPMRIDEDGWPTTDTTKDILFAPLYE
ncbi:arabinan endo-1,5-alpha-L-arabinosidase [Bacteroidales bacterium OttesenSCG-928-J19]|nr:arabinan endo-1,5-alpha-L-arabinosidase [Bacteroidales bacterium OttesenSCG-928-J19]